MYSLCTEPVFLFGMWGIFRKCGLTPWHALIPCLREHRVSACRECPEYPCEKIAEMLSRSAEKEKQCRAACENEAEFGMLQRAFYHKEHNLQEKPCRLSSSCDAGDPEA